MATVGLPPAFIPPVVVVPAVNAVVPVVAGAAATGVALPVLPLVGAVVVGAAVAGLAALTVAAVVNGQFWGAINNAVEKPPGYVDPSPTASTVGWVSKPKEGVGQLSLIWSSPDVDPNDRTITAPTTVERITVVRNYFTDMPWPGGTGWSYVALGYRATGGQMWSATFKVSEPLGYALFDGPGPNPIRLTGIRYFDTTVGQPAVELQPETTLDTTPRSIQPETEPEPAKVPPVAVPLPYAPPADPEAEPLTQPAPAQPAQPVVAPPVTKPAPVTPAAVPSTATPTTPAGEVQPKPKPPPVTTPTDTHVIDGIPIPGNGPQPTTQGIATELGRVENKLARLIDTKSDAPGQVRDRLGILTDNLGTVLDFFQSINAAGEYEISSPCVLDENGNRVVVKVPYSGALQSFGVLSNKIDALAQLLQEHKNLKQPNCSTKPVLTGEWVSVNFQSDEASSGGERPLRKVLRYRDQTAAPLEDHLAHWESFAWDAGPVIVISKNLSWGTPQVWAASVAEGKRVLNHAAQAAGVDLTDPKHEWVVTGSNDPRYGRTGRMRLDTRSGKFMRVTSRPSPSGLPSGFAPDP